MSAPRFSLFTSNRLDTLADHLAGVLSEDPPPPMEDEILVVHSRGMARWLTLRLADRLGIAAGLELLFPAPFCRRLVERLEGRRSSLAADLQEPPPLDHRDVLLWRLFAALDPAVAAVEARPPAGYLENDPDQRKRHQLALRLANLFDDYQLFRPDLLAAWHRGEIGTEGGEAWQAALWNALAGEGPEEPLSPRLVRLAERLEASTAPPEGLPRRLTVFGVGSLPPIVLRLLRGLALHLPVSLYFTSPTYHYWADLRSEREVDRLRRKLRGRPGSSALEHREEGHPLLVALGRQGRDLFHLLQDLDDAGDAWQELDFVDHPGDTLLHNLQGDILHLRNRGRDPEHPALPWQAGDSSLTFHRCHSPRREMEVLRDHLLAAFEQMPDLRLHQVLVLVPDVARYGPYIEAVFGARAQGVPHLPFRIADQPDAGEEPPAGAVLQLLDLVGSRLTPEEVFDLLDTAAVRRRFELAETDLPFLRREVEAAGIRWGIDGRQRRVDYDVPPQEANTWRSGIDRLLMGCATGPLEDLAAGIAPHAGDTAGEAQTLGRFATFAETLFRTLEELAAPRSPAEWAQRLADLLDELLATEGEREELALGRLRQALDALRSVEQRAGVTSVFGPRVLRDHLAAQLTGRGGRGRFLSGGITFCAMKPMRTIPFRMVAIAGLEDGSFPRQERPLPFDLVRREHRPGDRSLKDDDRQLFLETLLATGDRLHLSWVGSSQQDGSERAPSVVVEELLEVLERGFHSPDTKPLRQHLVTNHRLQAFHPTYFDPEGLLFSYSPRDLDAARARLGELRAAPRFLEAEATIDTASPDDGPEAEILRLDDLVDFWIHPPRHFCRRTLDLHLPREEDSEEPAEPFLLEGLAGYRLRDWLLQRRLDLSESNAAGAFELLRARGELPLAGLGNAHFALLAARVEALAARLPEHRRLPPQVVELQVGDRLLRGRLDDLTDLGLLRFRAARVTPRDRLRAYLLHLVWNALPLGADEASTERHTLIYGEGGGEGFPPFAGALERLEELVEGYHLGTRTPLPFFLATSLAFTEQRRRRADPTSTSTREPLDAARSAWQGERFDRGPGPAPERDDPYHRLCFRGRDPLTEPDFDRWSEAVWDPLLDLLREAPP